MPECEGLRWDGPTDLVRNVPTDYFIPRNLQPHFGEVLGSLAPLVTQARLDRFRKVAATRRRDVLCVFEDTNHSHNISAVMRTMDALGFQDVVFAYTRADMRFRLRDSVERGSSTWLSVRRGPPTVEGCGEVLRRSGYKVALVSLPTFHKTAASYSAALPEFPVGSFSSTAFDGFLGKAPLALVFGNEFDGLAHGWLNYADCYVNVPMYGFVESLNVSVCAGVILQSLRTCHALQKRGPMSDAHQQLLIEHWLAKSVPDALEVLAARSPQTLAYARFAARGEFFSPFDSIIPRGDR